jgi:hypothetical protein
VFWRLWRATSRASRLAFFVQSQQMIAATIRRTEDFLGILKLTMQLGVTQLSHPQ